MGNTPVNFQGLQSKAEYFLDDGFNDESIADYREAFKWHVANYLAIVHQAGQHAADLVGALPEADERGGYTDAFRGRYILDQTHQALKELLDEDAEMRGMISDGYSTTAEQDAEMRRQANEFNHDHHAGRNDEFTESARGFKDTRATQGEIENSAAGGNKQQQDQNIANANKQEPKTIEISVLDEPKKAGQSVSIDGEKPAELVSTTNVTVETPAEVSAELIEDPAMYLFGEKPTRVKIEAPDYSRKTPNAAFKEAVRWMIDHIVYVASGSRRGGSYPRIAPLMMSDVPEKFRVTQDALHTLVHSIRRDASRLRPPEEDGFQRALADINSDPDASPGDKVRGMLDALIGGMDRERDRSPFGDSAMEPGGFREGDGDAWQKGSADDEH